MRPLPQCIRHKNCPVRNVEFLVNIGNMFFYGKLGAENAFRNAQNGLKLLQGIREWKAAPRSRFSSLIGTGQARGKRNYIMVFYIFNSFRAYIAERTPARLGLYTNYVPCSR